MNFHFVFCGEYGYMLKIRTGFELLLYMVKQRATEQLAHDVLKGTSKIPDVAMAGRLVERSFKAMGEIIEKEPIYINHNGGWCTKLKEHGDPIRQVNLYPWPEREPKITISRWPNGRHYYARVDGEDVVIDGRMKWDTYGAAEKAAERWMQREEHRQ